MIKIHMSRNKNTEASIIGLTDIETNLLLSLGSLMAFEAVA